ASDVLGASGKAMLRALAAGESDPVVISELARGSLRKKLGDLHLALRGEMNEAQRFVLGELLQRVNELETAEYKVGRQINHAIGDREHPELFNAWELLQTIPGIAEQVAEVVIAEIGANLREVFPTAGHLASWAGVCPGNKATGGKRISGKTRKRNRYCRAALGQAAWAATHTKKTFLSAMYHRLVRRLGKKKALIAVAHALTVIIYNVLVRNEPYNELGADYFDRNHPDRQRKYLVKRLEALGYTVTLEQNVQAA